jgi:hypothetical protein
MPVSVLAVDEDVRLETWRRHFVKLNDSRCAFGEICIAMISFFSLVYFTFRQIFTDMEAVIVIHRSTRKCEEHLSQHNLQKKRKKNLNIN